MSNIILIISTQFSKLVNSKSNCSFLKGFPSCIVLFIFHQTHTIVISWFFIWLIFFGIVYSPKKFSLFSFLHIRKRIFSNNLVELSLWKLVKKFSKLYSIRDHIYYVFFNDLEHYKVLDQAWFATCKKGLDIWDKKIYIWVASQVAKKLKPKDFRK